MKFPLATAKTKDYQKIGSVVLSGSSVHVYMHVVWQILLTGAGIQAHDLPVTRPTSVIYHCTLSVLILSSNCDVHSDSSCCTVKEHGLQRKSTRSACRWLRVKVFPNSNTTYCRAPRASPPHCNAWREQVCERTLSHTRMIRIVW